ncbi:MAG: helix-turn-helix domain-containing protein [Thomasclavelia sp.]|uniref:helix-turn-helix domain-containing protein n=1 Tax=Thomasclavelia sp. TaxID=3025757 RepID=UPI00399FBAE8
MSVGLILKQLRRLKNISQGEIAEMLGLSLSSIYRFENGGQISYDNYLKYCKCIGVSPYIPIIICSNDKMLLLYNRICQTILDKDMRDVILSVFIQELNQGIDEQFEKIFLELDKKINDDFIKII